MVDNINGKVVVITGASSGLGEAAARHLASLGARVVVGARRKDRIERLAQEITKGGHTALAVQTDVTKRGDVENLVNSAVRNLGRIDVIVNNAGVMPLAPLDALKVDEWDHMIDVNFKGTLYGIAAALPHMKAQKSGHIINLSSVAGHVVWPGAAVYCATKYAVRALSEGVRQEVKPYNIRTTVISPGATITEIHDHISDEEIQANDRAFVARVGITPDSFARIVAFAISEPESIDINEILYRPNAQPL